MELESTVSPPDLSGHTVVLPAVSVGNVGQLAVDVILATLQPKLVSQVCHLQIAVTAVMCLARWCTPP